MGLFRSLPARLIGASGDVQIPRHDCWTLPGSIPGRLGIREETLPRAPYLPGRDGGAAASGLPSSSSMARTRP